MNLPLAAPLWLVLVVTGATVAMLLEALLLLAWHRRTGGGLAPRTLLPTLVAGGALMAALLALLAGAPPVGLLPLLALAGLAHGLDLQRRWVRGTRRRDAHHRVGKLHHLERQAVRAGGPGSVFRSRSRAPGGSPARGRHRTTRR